MTNLCSRFIANVSERLAQDPRIPLELRDAYRETAATVLHQQFLAMLPDRAADSGCLRFYPPQELEHQRQMREQRVKDLLASGMAPAQVATATGCSRTHAYRVQSRMRRSSSAKSQQSP